MISFFGAPGGIRTLNLLFRRQLLFPIELRARPLRGATTVLAYSVLSFRWNASLRKDLWVGS